MANKFKNVSLDTIALIFLNFSEFQSNNMLFEIVLKSYCEKFGKTKLKMTFKDFDRPRSPLTFINSNAARFTIIPEISLIEIKMFIPSIISALSESDKVYFNIEDFGDFYLKVINVMPKLKQKYPLAYQRAKTFINMVYGNVVSAKGKILISNPTAIENKIKEIQAMILPHSLLINCDLIICKSDKIDKVCFILNHLDNVKLDYDITRKKSVNIHNASKYYLENY
jgi:hypothetical protein